MKNRIEILLLVAYLWVWALTVGLAIYNDWILAEYGFSFIIIPLMILCGSICFYNLHLMHVEEELENNKREQERDELRKRLGMPPRKL
jgi:hypothetical protein